MRLMIAAFVALLLVPLIAHADPLADRVPADSIIYIGWQGVSDLGPGYPQSHLKAVLDQSQVPDLIDKFIPQVIDKVSQLNPQAGQIGQIISSIAKPTWQHPTAFFFAGIEHAKGKEPVPHLGIVWQPGADGDALARQLSDLIAQAAGAPFPIKVIHKGEIVALMVGYDNPEEALAGRTTRALSEDAAFKAARAHLSLQDSVFAAYVDYEHLFGLIDDLVKEMGPPPAQQIWPTVRDDLGLPGLKRVVAASGFDGKDFGTQAFLEAPAPRTGLFKVIGDQPLSEEILSAIPSTATMAGAGRIDLGELFDLIHKTAADVDADDVRDFDRMLEKLNQQSGVDLRRELLASLGDEWAYFADPTIGGRGLASFTAVNHLKDPAKFEQSIDKMQDFVLKQFQEIAGEASGQDLRVNLSFQTTQVDGMTIHYLPLPLVAPSWVVQDGNLYISMFPQVAAAAARHQAMKKPSIMESAAFKDVLARLGQQKFSDFGFMDLPRTAPDAYGAWLFISRITGFGDLFGIKSPPLLMPQLDKLLDELSPAGQVNWADADGFHMRSIEPFPASTLIASDPMITALYAEPAMIGVMLPALQKAREQARRVQSMNNLRQIGLAAMMYANANNNKFPPDLATIYKDEDLTPSVFVNPRTHAAPPPPGTKEELAKWVQENSDYVWIGGNKTAAAGPDSVLAYEKLEENPEGVNILFGDGHVEWVPTFRAREMIKQ